MTLDPGSTDTAQAVLEATRQKVEDRLGALRAAVNESTGGRMGLTWTLPLIAAAVGFSVAMLLRRRARRDRLSDGDSDWD
jgi:hypothetical protein